MARKRLNSARSVLQYIACVIHDFDEGKINANDAKTKGYLCNILLKGFEIGDLEERIEALEKLDSIS
jgi:hypothetical protein